MFTDARSKTVVFVAHCVLNQNSISDGTAIYPGFIQEIMELLCTFQAGIVQIPCPELLCLSLDRGNIDGSTYPIVEENTRIRKMMSENSAAAKIKQMVQNLVFQILEYRKYGFHIMGIVGINRSPTCGVETTSKNNREVEGEGVFIEALRKELHKNKLKIEIVGIKPSEPKKALKTIQALMDTN